MVAKISEANNVLRKRPRRKPTYDELAEVLNVNVSTATLVSERSRQPISLDNAVTDYGNLTFKEIIPGPVEMTPEKMVERQLIKQGFAKLLNEPFWLLTPNFIMILCPKVGPAVERKWRWNGGSKFSLRKFNSLSVTYATEGNKNKETK
ncbi:unnamed protein product [Trifolium pratense]|uniref:Uncharacterized protein n=1 Tax=Trifolium pratense TaxID=57577 RepID=A0ACB0J2D4_TRIPR|nr:unnamed protein product [Trifolium pratense]